jgi:hypothetical protein
MNSETSNVVWVRLKCDNLIVGIVVENTEMKVVRACNKPILASDEPDTAHRDGGNFKRLDDSAGFMVVDVNGAVVVACQEPWLGWMKVDVFDTF